MGYSFSRKRLSEKYKMIKKYHFICGAYIVYTIATLIYLRQKMPMFQYGLLAIALTALGFMIYREVNLYYARKQYQHIEVDPGQELAPQIDVIEFFRKNEAFGTSKSVHLNYFTYHWTGVGFYTLTKIAQKLSFSNHHLAREFLNEVALYLFLAEIQSKISDKKIFEKDLILGFGIYRIYIHTEALAGRVHLEAKNDS
jgi:hypothetical protein